MTMPSYRTEKSLESREIEIVIELHSVRSGLREEAAERSDESRVVSQSSHTDPPHQPRPVYIVSFVRLPFLLFLLRRPARSAATEP